MLVIQHHWRRWTAPAERIPLPGPRDVDIPPHKAFGWAQVFDGSEDPVRLTRLRLEPRPDDLWAPLEWRGSAREIEIGLHRPGGLRSDWKTVYHAPEWLFTLRPGQTARVQWDGRFGRRGALDPCFEDHVYWIGVGDPAAAMFRDRAPDVAVERLYLRT